ncbi:MAG: hypothetical protein HN796_21215 [Gemmatimonadetes bacterium]|nr:hypothetical protein [Gemmatimonadota bacterium]
MNRTVSRYLERRTLSDQWPLLNAPSAACRSIIVIPCLGEYPGILDTLGDLSNCADRDDSLVIVVVNNRAATPDSHSSRDAAVASAVEPTADTTSHDIALNAKTLTALHDWDQRRLRVAWIDASSPGNELPAKQGVGLARKIGLDWGLQILASQDDLSAPLVCLDGDTRVDPDYLHALHRFFDTPSRWAGILPYAHPIDGDAAQQAAILCYEFFLRYHATHLAWAGSPYGYHAIGSAMACTAAAYAAISGMNRRQAGEDFYFLQQLAKTGSIEVIDGTIVRPSGRPSHRVPFGTGRRVQRFLDGTDQEYQLYHPNSYEIIRQWLQLAGTDQDGDMMMQSASDIHPQLATFLLEQKFTDAWNRMHRSSPSQAALYAQFHEWFDGFRTLKLIHHLRDTSWSDAPMFEAIGMLLSRIGVEPVVDLSAPLSTNLASQEALLQQLREIESQ